MVQNVSEFVDDDAAYFRWVEEHPQGFVVNTRRGFSPDEMVLHHASCSFISPDRAGLEPGAYTERQYVKVCGERLEALSEWCRAQGRPDGSFTKTSCRCRPKSSTPPATTSPPALKVELDLPRPTPAYVAGRLEQLRSDEWFYGSEETVGLVFKQWPRNAVFAEVHAKVVVLNTLYSAGVLGIHLDLVARHILTLDTDERLRAGDLTLVRDLCRVPVGGEKPRIYYSLATKYCSWHRQDVYQIYDSYVDWLLWEYRKRFDFHRFQHQHLGVYMKFVEIVDRFQDAFGLGSFTRKDIDKFLWAEGKRLRGW